MQKTILRIKKELTNYSKAEKIFFAFAMVCGFLITSEYAVTKPTSNSIFIAHYGICLYPYAWLATVPLNFLVVILYNRFLPRWGCFPIFLCSVILTMGINAISGLYVQHYPFLSFVLYVWKDIYILLMFQQLWSIIHLQTQMSKAKYLYGILFGISGCGSIFGSVIPSFFAIKIGSEHLLFMTIPLYLLFAIFYYLLLKQRNNKQLNIAPCDIFRGMKLIYASPHIKYILLIVVLMQLSTTIMEFQFNTFLHLKLPIQDVRTQFYGKLWATINTCKLSLQFFATFLLIHFLGFYNSHFVVPGVLLCNSILALYNPSFVIMTYSFGVIKTFDYSIFNIIKEMLYVPLKAEEKFKAKAIIDVFSYRSAKALASLFVVGMQLISPLHWPVALSWLSFIIFSVWIGTLLFLTKKHFFTQTCIVDLP